MKPIEKYQRSVNGMVSVIYADQKKKSKTRGHNHPSYTVDELKQWLILNPKFESMYKLWVESGYDKWNKPSIDRIDSNSGYTLDNIQLLTWRENDIKGKGEKYKRVVNQSSLDGRLIRSYESLTEAQELTGINVKTIWYYLQSELRTSSGYRWSYGEST